MKIVAVADAKDAKYVRAVATELIQILAEKYPDPKLTGCAWIISKITRFQASNKEKF